MKYPLIVEEIGRHAWAVTDEAMDGILRAVESGLTASDEPVFHAARADIAAEFPNLTGAGFGYNHGRKEGSTGILRIEGPITPYASAFTNASGIVSAEGLAADLNDMAADASISRVVMVFDSPGGAATGISELAAQIADFPKPISSYVYGMAASAAYWLASASDEIISSDTGMVGSIGTVMTVASDKGAGRVKIVSSQSPRKQADPDTKDGRAHYQGIVDAMADVFIDTVAKNRETTRENVIENYGRGGIVMPAAALERGMVDGVSTLRAFMAEFNSKTIEAGCSRWEKKKKRASMAASDEKIEMEKKIEVDGSDTGIGTIDHAAEENRPVEADEKRPEEKEMTLKELLDSNPDARKEFEAANRAAVLEFLERTKVAASVAASDTYSAPIRALAVQVLAGTAEPAALVGAMSVSEMSIENKKSAEAAAASASIPDTPPQKNEAPSNDGMIRNESDFRAAVERVKGKR